MDRYCSKQETETSVLPSFSSTLLDAIYRSIDEADENMILRDQTMKKKDTNNFERVIKVDKWMEKQVVIVSGKEMKSTENSERKKSLMRNDLALFIKSSSSSSSSNSSSGGGGGGGGGGGFSSSDVESSGNEVSSDKLKNYAEEIRFFHNERERRDRRYAQQGSITRTKAKALKIYSDLKKLKQPISPGSGRVTNFLNSIFVAGNSKKTKNYDEVGSERGPKSGNASNCSSGGSSYTRSCLSKTPSSRGKSSNGDKRSVRFCPVSVIFDEEDKCSSRFKPNAINNQELKVHAKEKNLQLDKDANKLLISLQNDFEWSDFRIRIEEYDQVRDEEEDEDEDGSCASSDLFELKNLSDIGNGINKYLQELPVYETTSIHSNIVI